MRIYPALAFATFGLLSCTTVAIADQIGYDVTTGQKRALKKTDKTLVGTKQSIDAGQVIQRNSLGIKILPTPKSALARLQKSR
jgi:Flp pilus assembly protein CpaB